MSELLIINESPLSNYIKDRQCQDSMPSRWPKAITWKQLIPDEYVNSNSTWFQFGVYVYWYIQIHMAWLLTCLISLYTYRIQPPLQRLHTGHLHSNHVTATSLIVFDSFSSCTIEFDVEIRNHFRIWSQYTWEDALPVATPFLHLARVHSAVAQRDTLLFYHLRALKKTSNLATSGHHGTGHHNRVGRSLHRIQLWVTVKT